MEALLNADCTVEEIAFEIDSPGDEHDAEPEYCWDETVHGGGKPQASPR